MKSIKQNLLIIGATMLTSLVLTSKAEAATLTTIGDSINVGWVGTNKHVTPYGSYTAKKLGMDFIISGRDGNMFYPNPNYGDNYFARLIEQKKSNLQ